MTYQQSDDLHGYLKPAPDNAPCDLTAFMKEFGEDGTAVDLFSLAGDEGKPLALMVFYAPKSDARYIVPLKPPTKEGVKSVLEGRLSMDGQGYFVNVYEAPEGKTYLYWFALKPMRKREELPQTAAPLDTSLIPF